MLRATHRLRGSVSILPSIVFSPVLVASSDRGNAYWDPVASYEVGVLIRKLGSKKMFLARLSSSLLLLLV